MGSIPDKDFKVMITKMLKEFGEDWRNSEKLCIFNKVKNTKKNKTEVPRIVRHSDTVASGLFIPEKRQGEGDMVAFLKWLKGRSLDWAPLVAQLVKNLPATQETQV